MAVKREKSVKDQTITIRLEPEDAKKLDDLVDLIANKTSLDVTKSWVLRESLLSAYSSLKKKYEDM